MFNLKDVLVLTGTEQMEHQSWWLAHLLPVWVGSNWLERLTEVRGLSWLDQVQRRKQKRRKRRKRRRREKTEDDQKNAKELPKIILIIFFHFRAPQRREWGGSCPP
jgi:hypothetical protein